MPESKQIKKIKQNAMRRRLVVSMAGASGGTRLLANRINSVFMGSEEKQATRENALVNEAMLFTQKLGDLKGAYVKVGQMMALYGTHFLPRQLTDALHVLEHATSSLEWPAIEPVIKQALGKGYADFDIKQQPFAAASLSQVHLATRISDGRCFCFKVQYPGVANTIESDFKMILLMLRFTRWTQSGKDVAGWMQEIKAMLVDEVDYLRERNMTEQVACLLAGDRRYLVPTIEGKYSGQQVLTMDYIPGLEITDSAVFQLSQRRRNALAKSMLEVFFKEVFEWGIMQTDPNFGNYRVQLRDRSNGEDSPASNCDKLVMLDFGAVRKLDEKFMGALRKAIIAAHHNDRQAIIAAAIELNCLKPSHSKHVKQSFADFCILLMEPFRRDITQIPVFALNARNQYKWHESNLLKRAGKLGAKAIAIEGFSPPPREFALIARKLTGVFTFVTTLRAEINAHKILEQYL